MILVVLFLLKSSAVWSQDYVIQQRIFYPLPTLLKGETYLAKQLFLAQNNGFWIQDVHGKLFYFDRNHFYPVSLPESISLEQKLILINDRFYAFQNHEVISFEPFSEPKVVFSLTVGSQIRNMGVSEGYLWLQDEANFYSYHIDNADLKRYPLTSLYQLNQSSNIVINDADLIYSKWVLGTNSGAFLSEGNSFVYIKSSNKEAVQTMLFSKKNNQLIVGAKEGARVVDIFSPESIPLTIGTKAIHSIIEVDDGYWIAGDEGVFVYSVKEKQVYKLTSYIPNNYFNLPKGKVTFLLNDHQKGVWIVTEKGIRYFSLLSDVFQRILPPFDILNEINQEKAKVFSLENEKIKNNAFFKKYRYLIASSQGVSLFTTSDDDPSFRLSSKAVNDMVFDGDDVWLASEEGLMRYTMDYPLTKKQQVLNFPVDLIELDRDRKIWGVTNNELWSFDITNESLIKYGNSWMVSDLGVAKITYLKASRYFGLQIGTGHGVYVLNKGSIHYQKQSAAYGKLLSIVELKNNELWFLSELGLFRQTTPISGFEPIKTYAEHNQYHCLVASDQAVYLSSSIGISQYNYQGKIEKQFNLPHGTIMNEFLSGCSVFQDENETKLLFLSTLGMVLASEKLLTEVELPAPKLTVSQISVDYHPLIIGRHPKQPLIIPYDGTLGIQFSGLELGDYQYMEFSLNNEDWHLLPANQLAFSHLAAGSYLLGVRFANAQLSENEPIYLQFEVLKSWYQSYVFFAGMAIVAFSILFTFYQWKNQRFNLNNQRLKRLLMRKVQQNQRQNKYVAEHYQRVLMRASQNLMDLESEEQESDEHSIAPVLTELTGNEDKRWRDRVDVIIGDNYENADFSTSDMAKLLYVSERSLQRHFKNITHKTFKEYLTEYRLEKACQFLLEGEKISQAAYLCGFNDPSYFSQRFKQHFGVSPSQFIDDNEV